eukprot:1557761-Amphidinium_carterae.1
MKTRTSCCPRTLGGWQRYAVLLPRALARLIHSCTLYRPRTSPPQKVHGGAVEIASATVTLSRRTPPGTRCRKWSHCAPSRGWPQLVWPSLHADLRAL